MFKILINFHLYHSRLTRFHVFLSLLYHKSYVYYLVPVQLQSLWASSLKQVSTDPKRRRSQSKSKTTMMEPTLLSIPQNHQENMPLESSMVALRSLRVLSLSALFQMLRLERSRSPISKKVSLVNFCGFAVLSCMKYV